MTYLINKQYIIIVEINIPAINLNNLSTNKKQLSLTIYIDLDFNVVNI